VVRGKRWAWEQIVLALILASLATVVSLRLGFVKTPEGGRNLVGTTVTYGLALLIFLVYLAVRAPWLLDDDRLREIGAVNKRLEHERARASDLESRLQPKLGIKNCIYKTMSPTQRVFDTSVGRIAVRGPASLWVQIVPECLTETSIEDCRGSLLRVRKWADSGAKWDTTEFDETLSLGWSLDEGRGPSMTIHKGVERRLNVFTVYEETGKMAPCVSTIPLRATAVFDGRTDIFRFDLALTAKECKPLHVCLEATYGTEWDSPRVAIIHDPNAPPVVSARHSVRDI
jgi:hypothetical protein